MLAIRDAGKLVEERFKQLFALYQRQCGRDFTIQKEQVEYVIFEPAASGFLILLKEVECGVARFVQHHDLAVEDGLMPLWRCTF